jgi:hypothetical protein
VKTESFWLMQLNSLIKVNGRHICKEWNTPAFHYRHIHINHPENETQVDQKDDGETHNNTRGRNRRFS